MVVEFPEMFAACDREGIRSAHSITIQRKFGNVDLVSSTEKKQ